MKNKLCESVILKFVVFLVLNFVFVPASNAFLFVYDNRSDFEQKLSNFDVINFNDVGYYFPDPGYKSGEVTINAVGGLYGWEGQAVYAGNSGTITISLEPGIKALGFDIGFAYDRLGAYLQYTITGASGVIAENAFYDPNMIISRSGSFFGFVSDNQDILELTLYAHIPYIGVFPIIDNVTYGNPVPEPISMLLFGTGVIGIGGYIKKRFKQN